jgi:hypothetical protein
VVCGYSFSAGLCPRNLYVVSVAESFGMTAARLSL